MIAPRKWSVRDIANSLDYAVLKPTASVQDIVDGAIYAARNNLVSVCVASTHVSVAAEHHKNVSAVIGFPHGNVRPSIKMAEARQAIEEGAKELDVVVNYGRYLGGDISVIGADLIDLCTMAHEHDVIVKAILETCYYTHLQIRTACRWCVMANTDYIKTSTGFGKGPATIGDVEVILDAVKFTKIKVKASGGIKCYKDVARYLDIGCRRIGASRFEELLP